MILIKCSLLSFLFLIKFSNGAGDCTVSNILLDQYGKGHYGFFSGQRVGVNSSTSNITYYAVTELAYYNNCLGLSTETLNTIVLDCPEQNANKTGCFQVISPQFDAESNNIVFTEKEEKICVSKVSDSCVGLKVTDETKLILQCYVI